MFIYYCITRKKKLYIKKETICAWKAEFLLYIPFVPKNKASRQRCLQEIKYRQYLGTESLSISFFFSCLAQWGISLQDLWVMQKWDILIAQHEGTNHCTHATPVQSVRIPFSCNLSRSEMKPHFCNGIVCRKWAWTSLFTYYEIYSKYILRSLHFIRNNSHWLQSLFFYP